MVYFKSGRTWETGYIELYDLFKFESKKKVPYRDNDTVGIIDLGEVDQMEIIEKKEKKND